MLIYLLFHISDTDLKTRQIADRYIIAICIFAIACAKIGITKLNLTSVNTALAVLILSSLFVGLGDAKLFAALTLIFGSQIFLIAFTSFCLAGLYSLLNVLTKSLSLKDSIAFAPFIAIASLSSWICILGKI